MEEWWAKRSLPPSSGVMNPKPLESLNHFTVPVAMFLLPSLLIAGRIRAPLAGMTIKKWRVLPLHCLKDPAARRLAHARLALLVGEFSPPGRGRRAVQMAVVDAPARDVVRRHLQAHPVARDDADAPLAHLAAGVREHVGAVLQAHAELRIRQHLVNRALHLDHLFL